MPKQKRMPREYRLMIYFIVASLHLCRNSIHRIRGRYTVETFEKAHQDILARINADAQQYFKYIPSSTQMRTGIAVYLDTLPSVTGHATIDQTFEEAMA